MGESHIPGLACVVRDVVLYVCTCTHCVHPPRQQTSNPGDFGHFELFVNGDLFVCKGQVGVREKAVCAAGALVARCSANQDIDACGGRNGL
jgi:hypothetical protein